jgi:hypothetical protein
MENAKQEKKPVKAFQAYARGHASKTADTPKQAAEAFFSANPRARKCDVIEGVIEVTSGVEFFVIKYGRTSEGEWPQSFRDVTKKTAGALPDEKAGVQKV